MADSAPVPRVPGPRALDRSSILPPRRRRRAAPFDRLEGRGSVDGQARHRPAPTLRDARRAPGAAVFAIRPCGASALKATALRLGALLPGPSAASLTIILAVGLVLGTFPMYGCPTVFCLLAAIALRLNAPALQLVNQLSSPLQLALLIPFARLGERDRK